jgi:hypothetical protein
LLQLGNALRDKSPLDRMRDSSALQLFSVRNCLICGDNNRFTELLYLLPWSPHEEVMKNRGLSPEGRLQKAILSFKLLLHYFVLSATTRADGVSPRFDSRVTQGVTFAEGAV